MVPTNTIFSPGFHGAWQSTEEGALLRVSLDYRPDIDGLRALAVLSVLFFHVGISAFSGGFVGVDVFFVISGFLITRNIVSDIEKHKFSFKKFYMRRVRRLFPALFFTLVLTFVVCVFLFPVESLARVAKVTIFSIFSTSNFIFWNEAGYFDTPTNFKPLLHTWSLSVEEQFYLVWPALLVLLLLLFRNLTALVFLLLLGLASLWSAEYLLDTDDAAVFYLTPFRIIEFVIGAACVWLVAYKTKSNGLLEALFLLGLGMILYAVSSYSTVTRFPGANALLPCIGAALVIFAGTAKYSGRLLNNRLMVGIGLISYSLYLAHWPLLVFLQWSQVESPTVAQNLVVAVVSVFVAIFMYFYIEKPFRYQHQPTAAYDTSKFIRVCVIAIVALTVPVFHAWISEGWKWRYPEIVIEVDAQAKMAKRTRQKQIRSGVCHAADNNKYRYEKKSIDDCVVQDASRQNVLIFGSSYSADLYMGLVKEFVEIKFLQVTAQGCNPGIGYGSAKKIQCQNMSQFMVENTQVFLGVDAVFISHLWTRNFAYLESTFTFFDAIDIPVVIIGPRPRYNRKIPELVAFHGRKEGLEEFLHSNLVEQHELRDELKRFTLANSGRFVDAEALWFGEGYEPVFKNGQLLIFDDDHWTVDGAYYFARRLRNAYSDLEMLYQ